MRVAPFARSHAAARLFVIITAIAVVAVSGGCACAQGKVEAIYRASLAGIPIGSGTWVIDIGPKNYAGAATGHASGLMRVLVSGEGSSTVRGIVRKGRLVPAIFAANIRSADSYDVHM